MMRIKGLRHIASIYTICASLAFAAAMFLSCQKDIEKDLVTLYPIIKSNIETSVETRALAGNYSDYNTGTRQSIYAYAHAYNYTSTPQEGIDITGAFVPSTAGGWRSTLKAEDNVSYYLYCHTAIPGATGYSLNFTDAGHVNLSFSNLSVISDTDPLVSVAASGKTLPDNPAANTYPELTDGSYDIGKVEHVKENGIIVQSTKVFLALKHLYAKATLSFKIDADYNSLRTVKVKEVTVSTTQGATLEGSSFKYNYITHELNTEGGAISNTTTQKTLDIIRGLSSTAVFDDDGMTEITLKDDDFYDFGWFTFLPTANLPSGSLPLLNITVTYDVYDKTGVLVRENQTATNGNILKGAVGTAGNNNRIRITVKPTYLYVLSDNDAKLELSID